MQRSHHTTSYNSYIVAHKFLGSSNFDKHGSMCLIDELGTGAERWGLIKYMSRSRWKKCRKHNWITDEIIKEIPKELLVPHLPSCSWASACGGLGKSGVRRSWASPRLTASAAAMGLLEDSYIPDLVTRLSFSKSSKNWWSVSWLHPRFLQIRKGDFVLSWLCRSLGGGGSPVHGWPLWLKSCWRGHRVTIASHVEEFNRERGEGQMWFQASDLHSILYRGQGPHYRAEEPALAGLRGHTTVWRPKEVLWCLRHEQD